MNGAREETAPGRRAVCAGGPGPGGQSSGRIGSLRTCREGGPELGSGIGGRRGLSTIGRLFRERASWPCAAGEERGSAGGGGVWRSGDGVSRGGSAVRCVGSSC